MIYFIGLIIGLYLIAEAISKLPVLISNLTTGKITLTDVLRVVGRNIAFLVMVYVFFFALFGFLNLKSRHPSKLTELLLMSITPTLVWFSICKFINRRGQDKT